MPMTRALLLFGISLVGSGCSQDPSSPASTSNADLPRLLVASSRFSVCVKGPIAGGQWRTVQGAIDTTRATYFLIADDGNHRVDLDFGNVGSPVAGFGTARELRSGVLIREGTDIGRSVIAIEGLVPDGGVVWITFDSEDALAVSAAQSISTSLRRCRIAVED